MSNYDLTEEEFISLIDRLSKIASPSRMLATTDNESGTYLEEENQRVEINIKYVYDLLSALKRLPAFSSYKDGGFSPNPELMLGGDISPNLALWLLAQSRLLGAEAAYKCFCCHLANPVELQAYYALWGVRPSKRIQIVPDVYIIPIEEIPPSSMRDALIIPDDTDNNIKMRFPYIRLGISAAITFTIRRHRTFLDNFSWCQSHLRLNQKLSNNTDEVKTRNLAEVASEIVRILPLVVNRSIKHTHTWYHANFGVPIIGGSRLAHTSPLEHTTFSEVIKEPNFRPEDVGTLIGKYLSWKKSDREKMHLALDRVNRAMRAAEIRDHAIDLGIVLESILTKAEETTEVTYKIKLRGAKLLGGNMESVKKNFEFFGKLYALRSKAVHGQDINKMRGIEHFGDFLRKGDDIAAKLILKIIERGHMPDLDEIVFGKL